MTRDGARAAKLLSGGGGARSHLGEGGYVSAAMMPIDHRRGLARVLLLRRRFLAAAGDQVEMLFDEDATAMMRYAEVSLLPVVSDPRFSLTSPPQWRDRGPSHPLPAATMHDDRDGFAPLKLLVQIDWVQSHAEPAV